ncbi:hypothetical protein [Clostridium sp. YIM B02555]|uniref:hypothetical protein n=1 Tax=Clostridium sp. YIM B02555 TaxID=2911968 RepID=UPI001EEDD35D|nr:hypothetical protein [Clostridium sp. YIM B02555]
MVKKTIVAEQMLNEYNYYIWEVMFELRAAEGLDNVKMQKAFEILEEMSIIYKEQNQIDKIVVESFITIPGNMFLISKEDIIQGKEIELVSKKLSEYRKNILQNYKKNICTIVDKNLINELRESSIGKEGFLTLVDKCNIYEKQKVKNTFEIVEKMIDVYKGKKFIDTEVGYILISIYEYLCTPNLQNSREILNNVSSQFQTYLRMLVEVDG